MVCRASEFLSFQNNNNKHKQAKTNNKALLFSTVPMPHLLGFVLWFMVIVAQPAISPLTPGVETAIIKDTGTVRRATGNFHHTLAPQRLNKTRSVLVAGGGMREKRGW